MKKVHRLLLTVVALSVLCLIAWAHASYTGRTLKSGKGGCGTCHATQTANVTVAITGPDTLRVGADGSYSVKISGGTGNAVCVDIATSAGALKIADSNLKLSSSELITNGVKSYSGGSYTYNFKLTAPATAQTDTLFATGMSTKSTYNFAPNKPVVIVAATDVDRQSAAGNKHFSLSQNYPNPFSAATEIAYTLHEHASVRVAVYDISGRECAVIAEGEQAAGAHHTRWDASSYPAGMYFCTLRVTGSEGTFAETIKMILSR